MPKKHSATASAAKPTPYGGLIPTEAAEAILGLSRDLLRKHVAAGKVKVAGRLGRGSRSLMLFDPAEIARYKLVKRGPGRPKSTAKTT